MTRLFTFVPDPSLEAAAEFRISIRSLPFLADHAFQDVVVLPGSFYIEMALSEMEALPSAASMLPGWKSIAVHQPFKSLPTNHFPSKRFRRKRMT